MHLRVYYLWEMPVHAVKTVRETIPGYHDGHVLIGQ